MPYDFQSLAAELLSRWRDILPKWLPGGRLNGREYECASILGGKGDSFKVNTQTGKWGEFNGGGQTGGDFIALFAAMEKIDQGEAFRRLSNLPSNGTKSRPLKQPPKPEYFIPPADAAKPDWHDPVKGSPSAVYPYNQADGKLWFYVCRYDDSTGKSFRPYVWTINGWVPNGWPPPRPLFGLDLLAQEPQKPVLIVEGEKSCLAARKLCQNYVVVTWPNGSNGWKNADFSTLKQRKILIWPDADLKRAKQPDAEKYGILTGELIPWRFQPGTQAALGIAEKLHGVAAEVKIIDLADWKETDGWDAADALDLGWNYDKFLAWAKPRAYVYQPPEIPAEEIVPEPPVEIVRSSPPAPVVNIHVDDPEKSDPPITEALTGFHERLGISKTGNGNPIPNLDNCLKIMNGLPDIFDGWIWYDEFHRRVFVREGASKRPLSSVDVLNLLARFQRDFGFPRISEDEMHRSVKVYAHARTRNEPKDWLETLVWDGTERIPAFFSYYMGCELDAYTEAVSKNFWISMVARVYDPGCKVDNMIVIYGSQGAFKSTALEAIGGKYYAICNISVDSPNFFYVLEGKMLIEIAEMNAFTKADMNKVKTMLSTPFDRQRRAYDREATDNARTSVFAGTTNTKAYLRDETGSRRFWPITAKKILLTEIRRDREQLFAEAVARFKRGENWYETPAAGTAEAHAAHREHDVWEKMISDWLENNQDAANNGISYQSLFADVLNMTPSKVTKIEQNRVYRSMVSLGWDQGADGVFRRT